jgi:Family of unknown function (DUF6011)
MLADMFRYQTSEDLMPELAERTPRLHNVGNVGPQLGPRPVEGVRADRQRGAAQRESRPPAAGPRVRHRGVRRPARSRRRRMNTQTRRSRATQDPAPSTTPLAETKSTATTDEFDFDRLIVDRVDDSIWRALFDGHFRLAVPCEICGRPLVTLASKMARRGPRCAEKAGDA